MLSRFSDQPEHAMKTFTVKKQQGQVFIVVALSLVMLVGAVGLAVDAGMGYLIKAKLNAAVDAAAVAGARASTEGQSQSQQRENAIAAAEKFFAANYPDGYLGTVAKISTPAVTFDSPSPGRITVDVNARVTAATSFMRVLGIGEFDVKAEAQTIRRDLDMAFVVDTSGSMSGVGAEVRKQASAFLDKFSPSSDRMALIHFSIGAEVDQPIKTDGSRGFNRNAMQNDISHFSFGGLTNSAEGFWHGRNQLNSIPPARRSGMRVIVFFSDGSPNTFASVFKFKDGSCNKAGAISSNDSSSGDPTGLWDHTRQQEELWGCYKGGSLTSQLKAQGLPNWYNAHNVGDQEFRVVTNSPRVVTNDTSNEAAAYANINRASKNLAEAMAAKAREEGIYVFTLGLGDNLKKATGPSTGNDTGENLLKCMANTADALPRCQTAGASQPKGVYCFAKTSDELQPCFAMLASEILRITR
jgi:Mg-chelatase subunit ChlD